MNCSICAAWQCFPLVFHSRQSCVVRTSSDGAAPHPTIPTPPAPHHPHLRCVAVLPVGVPLAAVLERCAHVVRRHCRGKRRQCAHARGATAGAVHDLRVRVWEGVGRYGGGFADGGREAGAAAMHGRVWASGWDLEGAPGCGRCGAVARAVGSPTSGTRSDSGTVYEMSSKLFRMKER
eukprot:354001-Chlamydomonas_euryale.AAC.10